MRNLVRRLELGFVAFLLFVGVPAGVYGQLGVSYNWNQPEVVFKPRKVGREGNGEFNLSKALAIVARDTENALDASGLVTRHEEKRSLKLRGKSFWQSIAIIEKTFGVSPTDIRRTWMPRAMLLEHGPQDGDWIHTEETGVFRYSLIRDRSEKGHLYLLVEAEPRLRYLIPTSRVLRYTTGNNSDFTISALGLWSKDENVLCFQLANKSTGVASLQCKLEFEYYYDWQEIWLGLLNEMLGKEQALGVVHVKPRIDGTRRANRLRDMRILPGGTPKRLIRGSDLLLRYVDGDVPVARRKPEEPSGSAYFWKIPDELPNSKLFVGVRVPHKVKKKIRLSLRYRKK